MKSSISCLAVGLTVLLPAIQKRASAQTQVPQAETTAGPALASANGTTFLAWKGWKPTGYIWYSTFNGSAWASQQHISSETNVAPALAAANGTVYLALKGPNEPSDSISYTNWNGSTFVATSTVPGAKTTAAPALAGYGSTLYLAWTTTSDSVEYATYAGGSWSAPKSTPASTNTQIAPALAAYDGNLYLAWVDSASSQLMYAELPLSGGSWSSAKTIGKAGSALTSLAPALGVFNATSSSEAAGLYVAYIEAGQVNYLTFGVESGLWIPGPIPPGPLATSFTPALVTMVAQCPTGETGSIASFSNFYTEAHTDIYFKNLLTSGRCYVIKCPPYTCQ